MTRFGNPPSEPPPPLLAEPGVHEAPWKFRGSQLWSFFGEMERHNTDVARLRQSCSKGPSLSPWKSPLHRTRRVCLELIQLVLNLHSSDCRSPVQAASTKRNLTHPAGRKPEMTAMREHPHAFSTVRMTKPTDNGCASQRVNRVNFANP